MLGRFVFAGTADFPYTFPIDFTVRVTGQIFDSAEEDNAWHISLINLFSAHVDLAGFLAKPIFPADGTAPTTSSTKVIISESIGFSKVTII